MIKEMFNDFYIEVFRPLFFNYKTYNKNNYHNFKTICKELNVRYIEKWNK